MLEVDALGLKADVIRDCRKHRREIRLADCLLKGCAGMSFGDTPGICSPELLKVCHLDPSNQGLAPYRMARRRLTRYEPDRP